MTWTLETISERIGEPFGFLAAAALEGRLPPSGVEDLPLHSAVEAFAAVLARVAATGLTLKRRFAATAALVALTGGGSLDASWCAWAACHAVAVDPEGHEQSLHRLAINTVEAVNLIPRQWSLDPPFPLGQVPARASEFLEAAWKLGGGEWSIEPPELTTDSSQPGPDPYSLLDFYERSEAGVPHENADDPELRAEVERRWLEERARLAGATSFEELASDRAEDLLRDQQSRLLRFAQIGFERRYEAMLEQLARIALLAAEEVTQLSESVDVLLDLDQGYLAFYLPRCERRRTLTRISDSRATRRPDDPKCMTLGVAYAQAFADAVCRGGTSQRVMPTNLRKTVEDDLRRALATTLRRAALDHDPLPGLTVSVEQARSSSPCKVEDRTGTVRLVASEALREAIRLL